MDPSKYYDISKNDTYCVHFPNKPGYSINEITKIFSEFGEVAGVTKAGDDYGFRFVRFIREDDTLRCIEALKNNPNIKLLPKRSKNHNEQRKNWSNSQDSRETKGGWTNWEQRKSDNGGNFRRDNGQKTTGYRDYNNRFSNTPTTEKNEWNTDKNETQSNFNDLNVQKINNEMELNKEFEIQVKKVSEERSIAVDNFKSADSSPQEIIDINEKIVDQAITPNTYAGSTKSSKTPVLQTVTEEIIGDANNINAAEKSENIVKTSAPIIPLIISDIPQLVEKHKKVETKNFAHAIGPKPTTVKAEAIVVGNVHREYGIHYILHLFQKHNPISVSPMKIVTKQGLRYCIVYLQTALQARDIEAEFDNYELSGKQLIVMRTQKLMQLVNNA